MTLAASKGTEIQVQCVGNKAEEDLNKLVDLIKNNFGLGFLLLTTVVGFMCEGTNKI